MAGAQAAQGGLSIGCGIDTNDPRDKNRFYPGHPIKRLKI